MSNTPSAPSGEPAHRLGAGGAERQAAPWVTVLGECVGDAFTEPAREVPGGLPTLPLSVLPGGGPANTAVALARLGTPTRFLGRLSTDVFGRLFRAHLTASGVDLDSAVVAQEPSTLAVATLGEDGSADYSFHADGAADFQWTSEELAHAASGEASCLHTGSLALASQPSGPRIEELLAEARRRSTVSIDPNVRPLLVDPAVYRERLPRWCALADILRLSDDDLSHVVPGARPEQAADHFHAAGVPLVVVTLGGDGVLACAHRRQHGQHGVSSADRQGRYPLRPDLGHAAPGRLHPRLPVGEDRGGQRSRRDRGHVREHRSAGSRAADMDMITGPGLVDEGHLAPVFYATWFISAWFVPFWLPLPLLRARLRPPPLGRLVGRGRRDD